MPFMSTHQHLPRRLPRDDQHCTSRTQRNQTVLAGTQTQMSTATTVILPCTTYLLLSEEASLVTVGHVDIVLSIK